MSRNIFNTPNRNMGRDITNIGSSVFVNTGILPIEITNETSTSNSIGLKGLSGFTANKIIKVNSAGDALEYADDGNTEYTARTPLLLGSSTLNEFSLSGLTGYGTAGQLIVSTSSSGSGSGTSLSYSSACKLQNIKTSNTNLLEENRFFEYTEGSDLIEIGNNTDTISFYSKSTTGSPLAINLPSVSSASVILTDTTLTASGVMSLTSNNITLNPSLFSVATSVQTGDEILMVDGGTFEKISKENFIASLPSVDASTQNSFGTASQTGTRTLGLLTQNTDIKGAFVNNIGTTIAFQVASTVLAQFSSSNFTINTGTLLRMGNNTVLTNSMSDVWTDCNIQTDKDINLYTVGENFTGTINRIGFIAGASEELTGEMGYAGSSINKASGGVPNGANNGVIGSMFMNATGSSANISFLITPIATDISSKVNKLTIDVTNTHSYNPIILDSLTTGQTFIDTGTSKDLLLKCAGLTFFANDASDRRHTLMGLGAINYASYNFSAALSVVNNATYSTDSGFIEDARIRIQSVKNDTFPMLEIINDAGTNSGTLYANYLLTDSNGSLFFNTGTSNTRNEVVVNNQNFRTTKNVYFTNVAMAGNPGGVYFILGSDEDATSGGLGWKIDMGGTGDLHFKFNDADGDLTNITQIKGYINQAVNSSQMNFTGQHRCIPENEILYNSVNDYIGMVVESTGQYNSIFTEETEEDFELITKTPEEMDSSTQTITKEAEIHKEIIKRRIQTQVITTEPTINEAQPIVKLTTTKKSKKVYGVISAKEDGNNRIFQVGVFASDLGKRNDNRLFINSLGEGGILVCNEMGNIENGDLLMSSSTAGIACKQDDDIVKNYTIGKATQDYNFVDANERKLIGCVYYCG